MNSPGTGRSGALYGVLQVGDAATRDDDGIVESVRRTGQVSEIGNPLPQQHRDQADDHLIDQAQVQCLGGDAGTGDNNVLVPGDLPGIGDPALHAPGVSTLPAKVMVCQLPASSGS